MFQLIALSWNNFLWKLICNFLFCGCSKLDLLSNFWDGWMLTEIMSLKAYLEQVYIIPKIIFQSDFILAPLFKKEGSNLAKNCRPERVVPIVSKIFERQKRAPSYIAQILSKSISKGHWNVFISFNVWKMKTDIWWNKICRCSSNGS